MDDILIFGSNLHVINDVKSFLCSNFEMKDLGVVDVILGIKLIKYHDGIVLTQSHYIEKLLRKFNYFDVKPVSTSFDSSIKLKKNIGESVSPLKYSQITGSLLHLSNFSRSDIAYVIGRLGRYTHNPDHLHWLTLERLFRYLKGTINYGIHYAYYHVVVKGFSDVNWIFDSDETKSTSGYVFTLTRGAVAWKSAKQTISRFTMEAEIIALDTTSSETGFLKNLLYDLPLLNKPIPPISMHCDSQVAIAKVTSKNFNEKRRHLRIRHKSIRNLITHCIISVDFIRFKSNLADPLTKGLTRQQVLESSREMGLKSIN
uniref:Retrovirus-related Pol polyprotein from transposon TNT 1-94 n=1 Tax=Cajanus cajan TaxID=3821 RepID=A0A151U3L8_CAJCA|nr:Retrovirus-related Pol polyprotein from transposon TNT 1-94 [Cajanus cajan]